jgi:hypothetical protein
MLILSNIKIKDMKELKKEFTNIYFLFGVLILMLMLISTQLLFSTDNIIKKIEQPTPTDLTYLTDFELIELAIIWQESKENPNPKHSDGKSEGILQITPIYVKEANRILGKSKYTLYDRKNPLKSHEMFLVVQNYHNPEKDVKKAVKLHNKAGWYFEEVMDRYNCLKLYQEILIFKNR